jgi:hypothetical protein
VLAGRVYAPVGESYALQGGAIRRRERGRGIGMAVLLLNIPAGCVVGNPNLLVEGPQRFHQDALLAAMGNNALNAQRPQRPPGSTLGQLTKPVTCESVIPRPDRNALVPRGLSITEHFLPKQPVMAHAPGRAAGCTLIGCCWPSSH